MVVINDTGANVLLKNSFEASYLLPAQHELTLQAVSTDLNVHVVLDSLPFVF